MNKDQLIAQILDTLGLHQAQERPVAVNIYFVESMIVGPGDFRHIVTQTAALNPAVPISEVNQSVARSGRDIWRDSVADAREYSEESNMGIGELAAAAAMFMGAKAAGKTAETIGGEVGNRLVKLYDAVKSKLAGPVAQETLADFEAKPDDARRRGALELQLEKAIEADPDFRATLTALVEEIRAKGGDAIAQTATVTGDRNITTQIAGSGNVVRR